jgi:hypothetical protein
VAGRIVRLGYFASQPTGLLTAVCGSHDRVDLLVVPPDTAAAPARQAFAAASDRANRRTPTAMLAALQPAAAPVPPPQLTVDRVPVGKASPAGTEATAVWDSEGGRSVS